MMVIGMRPVSRGLEWTTTNTETHPATVGDPAIRRRTWQRAAVAAALRSSSDFVSAQQLHARLSAAGERVGLATVYRSLQLMADEGDVDVVRNADGEATYRRCSEGHHHHLTCRDCGSTVEIDGAAAESWARQMAVAHGYSDVEHVFELFGRCDTCTRAQTTAQHITQS